MIDMQDHNVADFVMALAGKYQIKPALNDIFDTAEQITALSGDEVKLDDVELCVAELRHAELISDTEMHQLISGYFDETNPDQQMVIGFDPFGDFEHKGYLRNAHKDKNPALIKRIEHLCLVVNLERVTAFLRSEKVLSYQSLLKTHELLFGSYYPWAGKDRLTYAPDLAISKGDVMFCHPEDIERTVNFALDKVDRRYMGEVMGLLAYAHPFLDGNGRTLFLFYEALCRRKEIEIDWMKASTAKFLALLTKELESPNLNVFNEYLHSLERNEMKVYLDDERQTPEGWTRVYWPDEAIALLKTGEVEEISLDHDLGDDDRGTGYDVVLWIEEAVFTDNFKPPIMRVHSANSSARDKMMSGIRAIENMLEERK